MALDLTGFTIPEQKFEGLYKLGEELSAQRKAEREAKLAQAKAAKDEADKLKANQNLNFKLLYDMADPSKINSGAPTDPVLIEELQSGFNELSNFLNENPGAPTSQLYQKGYAIISKVSEREKISKVIEDDIKQNVKGLDPKVIDVNLYTQRLKEKIYYDEDKDGNLVLKDPGSIKIDPSVYQEVADEYADEIYNAKGVLDVARKIDKVQTTTQVGNTTTTVSLYPWQKIDKDGKPVTIVEKATQMDENNQPVDLTDDKGNPIYALPQNIYDNIIAYDDSIEKYLNGQLKSVSRALNKEVDPTSEEGILYKRALLAELLGGAGGGSFKKTAKTPRKTGGKSGGSTADKEKAQKRARLADTVNNRDVDADGYVDVTDIFPGYKYGKKSFGRNGVKYNPDTQKFKLTVIDEDGNTSEEEKSFNEVVTILQGSNSDKNLDFLDGFLEAKPRAKSAKSAKGTKGTKNKIF
jgi:hypothetical protein